MEAAYRRRRPGARRHRATHPATAGSETARRIVLSLGPATVAAGLVWALLQPYRITLLGPRGESFWWIAVQPPLLVVLVGVVYHFAVARGLAGDLIAAERDR